MIRSSDNKPKTVHLVKLTDENKTSNTTLAADADLQFPVKSGRFYFIEIFISIFTVNGTPGFKYSLDGPASTLARLFHSASVIGSVLTDTWNVVGTSGWPTSQAMAVTVLGGLKIELTYCPQSDGTFSLKWAQNTSSSNSTSVLSGSSMRYTEFG